MKMTNLEGCLGTLGILGTILLALWSWEQHQQATYAQQGTTQVRTF